MLAIAVAQVEEVARLRRACICNAMCPKPKDRSRHVPFPGTAHTAQAHAPICSAVSRSDAFRICVRSLDEQFRQPIVLDTLVERVGKQRAVLQVLHELRGREREAEADEETAGQVVVGLAGQHDQGAHCLGQRLDGPPGVWEPYERGEEVACRDGIVQDVEEGEARERERHAHDERQQEQRRRHAQHDRSVAQRARQHEDEQDDAEHAGEQRGEGGELVQEARLDRAAGEGGDDADEGQRVADGGKKDEDLLGPRSGTEVRVLLEPPRLPRRESRRVLALHPSPPHL
mmetsp:Transcript_27785/g.59810  ORF Transcript_27785/g.59810 Transcript_27785/m.59810 type:complete len:287 (+) Transcript_27785:437-1297(+)